MIRSAVIVALLLAAMPTWAGPSAPASRPAKAASDIELTPIGWLREYNTAMLNGDKADLLGRCHATGDDAKRLAETAAAHDAVVGKMLKLARDKYGADNAHLLGRTIGDVGNDDMANATVVIDGDTAVISVGGGMGTTNMIFRDGKWKIDFDQSIALEKKLGLEIDDRLKRITIKTKAAKAVQAAMEGDKTKTVDDALFILRRELSE